MLLQIQNENGYSFSCRRVILHLCNVWNVLDYLFTILYIVAFFLHLPGTPDLLLHIRRLYSVSMFLMFLKFLNFLLLFEELGIIIIMLKEMVCLNLQISKYPLCKYWEILILILIIGLNIFFTLYFVIWPTEHTYWL